MSLRYLLAALPLALGACGDDSNDGPDADNRPDATVPDAAPPDAIPRGPVTVTVTSEGNPIPGVDVVFNNPDGSVAGVEQTTSTGQAARDLDIGSSATIVADAGGQGFVGITFAAVKPGDQLSFEFDPIPPTDVGTFTATLPGVFATATHYEVRLGCTTIGSNLPTGIGGTITSDCLGSDTNIDAFAVALDVNDNVVAYDHLKDVAVVSGGPTALTFDGWQTTASPLAITLTNVPGGVTGAGLEPHWRVDGVDFGGVAGGSGPPSGGTMVINTGYPSGNFVDAMQYGIFFGYGAAPSDGLGILIAGHPATPATATHDLGALALPAISTASATATGGRVALSWTASGALASADGALVLVSWADTTPGTITDQWFALLPPDAASPYTMPEMPSDVAAFVPGAGATFATPTVIFAEGSYVDGYDAWRGGAGFDIFSNGVYDAIPAAGGVFRATIGGQVPGS